MKKNDNEKTIMRSVRIPKSVDDSINRYAASKHITASSALRKFVEKGLSVEGYVAEQDLIRGFIREEIETVLDKNLDRIIRLQLKSTQASSTMMFACIRVLSDIYADNMTFENILANAHKEAHAYMKQKEQPFEYHIAEARKMIEDADKITVFNDM